MGRGKDLLRTQLLIEAADILREQSLNENDSGIDYYITTRSEGMGDYYKKDGVTRSIKFSFDFFDKFDNGTATMYDFLNAYDDTNGKISDEILLELPVNFNQVSRQMLNYVSSMYDIVKKEIWPIAVEALDTIYYKRKIMADITNSAKYDKEMNEVYKTAVNGFKKFIAGFQNIMKRLIDRLKTDPMFKFSGAFNEHDGLFSGIKNKGAINLLVSYCATLEKAFTKIDNLFYSFYHYLCEYKAFCGRSERIFVHDVTGEDNLNCWGMAHNTEREEFGKILDHIFNALHIEKK